jgi:hypothetical protein
VYWPPEPVIADTATLFPVAGLNQNSLPGVVKCRPVPLMLKETADSDEQASCTSSGIWLHVIVVPGVAVPVMLTPAQVNVIFPLGGTTIQFCEYDGQEAALTEAGGECVMLAETA